MSGVRRIGSLVLVALLGLAGCQSGSQGPTGPGQGDGPGQESGGSERPGDPVACDIPADLDRSSDIPFGVLFPSGSFQFQSYSSAQEISDQGLNAVSIGWGIFYTEDGSIVFDRNGSSDDQAQQRWIQSMQCQVVEAKQAGLVVSVWGQFQQAGVDGEPGLIAEPIRESVLEQSVDLIPLMAEAAEQVKAEYFSPVSELDKYAGIEGHNSFFPRYAEAARPLFNGVLYSQPNILQRDPSFYSEQLSPALGPIDALGISWISYSCFEDDAAKGDWFIEKAAEQGVTTVLISEIGDVVQSPPTECLEELIERWGADSTGVFVLDSPPMMPDAAQINGSWQEDVLRDYLG